MLEQYLLGFERYVKVFEGRSAATAKAYVAKLNEFDDVWLKQVEQFAGGPAELQRGHVERYLEWCFYTLKNSNSTRHTKLTAIRKFWRYLRYEGVVTEDITAHIPRPKIARPLMQAFRKDEVMRMFAHCDITNEKGIRDVCILVCAAFAGMRISEIYGLNMPDVLDDGKDIDLNVLDTKHNQSRVIYLWKAPAAFIRQYMLLRIGQGAKGHDPVFISYKKGGKPKGHRLTAGAIDNLVKDLAEAAGVHRHKITEHMFRAMHANDLQSVKGYTMPAIQERLGWKDLSTVGKYLVRRERIHRMYNSLHEFWIEFPKIWTKNISNDGGGNAEN